MIITTLVFYGTYFLFLIQSDIKIRVIVNTLLLEAFLVTVIMTLVFYGAYFLFSIKSGIIDNN